MSDQYLGEIRTVGFNFAPVGWALCNGQLMSIAQNSALFALLGTTFGGDGRTTFGLPNLQGRVPIGVGNGAGLNPITWGEVAGTNNTTLLVGNMPQHNHLVNCNSNNADQNSPSGSILAVTNTNPGRGGTPTIYASYTQTAANATMSPTTIQTAGNNLPFSIMQPFLGLYFIIALQGIFPSRN